MSPPETSQPQTPEPDWSELWEQLSNDSVEISWKLLCQIYTRYTDWSYGAYWESMKKRVADNFMGIPGKKYDSIREFKNYLVGTLMGYSVDPRSKTLFAFNDQPDNDQLGQQEPPGITYL